MTHGNRTNGPAQSPPPRRGVRIRAWVVLAALVVGAALGSWYLLRVQRETVWVAEADAAVATYLSEHSEVQVAGMTLRDKYGDFMGLTGNDYASPTWNIQGYRYLTAHRHAQFRRATVPLRIHVTEGRVTAPG